MTKIKYYSKSKMTEIDKPADFKLPKIGIESVSVALKNFISNNHQNSANTKTKGEVRGGGRKPFKQKGTGNARAGSIRSPLWRGGGVTFGPKPSITIKKLPKKINTKVLNYILFNKLDTINIVDLVLDKPVTKSVINALISLEIDDNALMIGNKEDNLKKSCKNISFVDYIDVSSLNVYNLVTHKWVIFSQSAFEKYFGKIEISQAKIEKPEKKTVSQKSPVKLIKKSND
ncbi:MAG: large subunit ribosomal protein L4 [Candidatus Berkelbacteria bacterium Licking1014_85]|uniref:Large ribosomal subunit protein uL4 n=1 Tax=Candidatus Berkelbacteria bacterium Licking1014_85 TaxID=2017148 RepID=A0A554LM38_9BACT|nr:MAG: large subunit ribosomal protein L4 [Candidatus Berkelbacteria bacterium Licking1014_85]